MFSTSEHFPHLIQSILPGAKRELPVQRHDSVHLQEFGIRYRFGHTSGFSRTKWSWQVDASEATLQRIVPDIGNDQEEFSSSNRSLPSAFARVVGLGRQSAGLHDEMLPGDQRARRNEKNHWTLWINGSSTGKQIFATLIR